MLSDRKVKSLKPKEKRYSVTDGDGLTLYIEPSGKKTWYYRFQEKGKRKQKRIGGYPALGLHEARQAHAKLVSQRERGDIGRPGLTFEQVAKKAIETFNYADEGKEAKRSLKQDVYPYIGDMPIDKLKRVHVAELLEHKKSTPRQYNITKSRVSRICTYACQMGWIEANPCVNLRKAKENGPRRVVLNSEEIAEIVARRDQSEADRVLYFMLLTGQRGGECKGVKYSDIDGEWWICEQIKGGKKTYKRVYLVSEALEFIGEGEGRVFGLSTKGGLATHCARHKRRYRPHDIRRTCATILAAEGFDDFLIHRFLGHSVDKLTQTYNRHRYDPQLQEMAEALRDAVLKNPPAEGGATGGNGIKGP